MYIYIYLKRLHIICLYIYFTILFCEGDINRDCPYMCIALCTMDTARLSRTIIGFTDPLRHTKYMSFWP